MIASADRRRRGRLRPVVGGLLVAAALASLLMLVFGSRGPGADRSVSPLAGAGDPSGEQVGGAAADAASGEAAGEAMPAGATPAVADARAIGLTGEIPEAYRFTVALAPPSFPTDDSSAVRAFDAIFAAFTAGLNEIPHLELIAVDAADTGLDVDDADFLLQVRGETRFEPDTAWYLFVRWSATRGGTGTVSRSRGVADPGSVDTIGTAAAAALRRYPFPPEQDRRLELQARALNDGLTDEERLDALAELEEMPERFEFIGLDVTRSIAVTAVDIVANAASADIRARAWRALAAANIEDPYLTGPLVDSLLGDPSEEVRFEAVKLLAKEFADDPRAQTAIDYARDSDASPKVRVHARWEQLDDEGRYEYVRTTLLNEDLPHVERMELLLAEVGTLQGFVDPRAGNSLLGGSGRSMSPARAAIVRENRRPDNAAQVVPRLLELLEDEEQAGLRPIVASMLVEYSDDERVAEALAAVMDESPFGLGMQVRAAMARIEALDLGP